MCELKSSVFHMKRRYSKQRTEIITYCIQLKCVSSSGTAYTKQMYELKPGFLPYAYAK